ncbi:MAG TPA: NAD(P)H-binding protein [Kofleriaceae bacterium]
MKLLILGGTGGTGRQLVEQALAAGHDVTALVRDPAKAGLAHAKLTLVKGRATDADEIAAAVAGHDAVLSTLGPRKNKDPISADAAKATVEAMKRQGIKRLVWLSAGGVGDSAPQLVRESFVFGKIIMPLFLKHPYANHAIAEEMLRGSGLDYTIVRPVQLVNKRTAGTITAVPIGDGKVGGLKISRHDVAAWMLGEVAANKFVGAAPILHA